MLVSRLGLWILCRAYQFPAEATFPFLALTIFTSYIYLFKNRNLGFWMLIGIVFIYISLSAKTDAKIQLKLN